MAHRTQGNIYLHDLIYYKSELPRSSQMEDVHRANHGKVGGVKFPYCVWV